MSVKKLLLVFNPNSGTQQFAVNLFEVVDKLTRAGYEVTAYPTQAAGGARDIVLRRAADFDLLVCSGGDGTLSETVNALMACEKRPPLGYIPSGTANDFASSLGLPKDILDAAAVAVGGEPRMMDIGRFDGRYFSYIAAFGLFTDVSYATPQSSKNILGHLAYLLEGVKRLGSAQSCRCRLVLDGDALEGDYIFGMVTNSLSVGGFKLPGELGVKMDDGLLEIALLQMPTSFIDLQNIIASLINQEIYTDSLIFRHASSVAVTSAEPVAWTLDGEFGGEYKEVEISNCHRAVRIMMPTYSSDGEIGNRK